MAYSLVHASFFKVFCFSPHFFASFLLQTEDNRKEGADIKVFPLHQNSDVKVMRVMIIYLYSNSYNAKAKILDPQKVWLTM